MYCREKSVLYYECYEPAYEGKWIKNEHTQKIKKKMLSGLIGRAGEDHMDPNGWTGGLLHCGVDDIWLWLKLWTHTENRKRSTTGEK